MMFRAIFQLGDSPKYIFSTAVLLIVCSVGTALNSQETDLAAMQLVGDEADAVIAIRPSQILESKPFQQLDRETNGKATKLVALLTDTVFKMSLAKLEEIDEIVFSAKQQLRFQDESAFVNAIIRTKGDNLNRFEMVTHEAEVTEEYQGKEILGLPRGGFNKFRFASIIDNKTIVWSYGAQGIRAAIDAEKGDFKKTPWYETWKQHEKMELSFGMNSRIFLDLEVPESLLKNRNLGGGLKLDSTCGLNVVAKCVDQKDAENLNATANELLEQGKKALEKLAEIRSKLELDEAIKLGRRIADGSDFRIKGNNLEFSANFVLETARFAPMIEAYITQIELAQEIARRRKLGRALIGFEQAYGYLPAPIMEHKGKKHSWRVAILPFVGEANLYASYKFDEDWNSPHNQKVTAKMPDIYRHPTAPPDSTESDWYLLHGESAVFDLSNKRKLSDITDGPSNTIMAVEAKRKSHWAEPTDFALDKKIIGELGGFEEDGFHAIFADGQSHFLSDDIDRDIIFSLMTANSGDTIDDSQWRPKPK